LFVPARARGVVVKMAADQRRIAAFFIDFLRVSHLTKNSTPMRGLGCKHTHGTCSRGKHPDIHFPPIA
jgi:hypothetical protein